MRSSLMHWIVPSEKDTVGAEQATSAFAFTPDKLAALEALKKSLLHQAFTGDL